MEEPERRLFIYIVAFTPLHAPEPCRDSLFAKKSAGNFRRFFARSGRGESLLDLDPARFFRLGFRDDHFQNAILARCRDVLAIDAIRQ